ncbi:5-carboxymethyl-2-hydroxymuconate Delta-isomerase [Burkholderia vietnamiensis]|uniref:5-carboxymethyl-2-hydroxymuconate Delta-isomerase n=1 Tax=Burkholderia vietnamiensis TaxID=60552 RepID=UPI001CF51EB8|nr:5-carboxymethyl-2-hydroxymuconate Delta-isomerase [Burkholderia vietnamiensis]MCA8285936.1 5-carboxymethyl-2-hydroxymuconate Delta-isomerase [Burkholderia vietnamiensis]
MPHIIVEYTANIRDDAHVPALLRTINATLIAQGGVFPTGGIRSRAIELHDYCVADGTHDDAFVHVTLKIAAGRSDATKKAACDALFAAIAAHFAPLYATRYLALSMELIEFSETGSYKQNNIHARYQRAG